MIISHFQAKEILVAMQAKKGGMRVSLDLGLTTTPLLLTKNDVTFPDGQKLTVKQLQRTLRHENKCYFVVDNDLEAINIYSETTDWMRTLYPTKTAPTTLVSGFLMHRIKNTDPLTDTKGKVAALGKIQHGIILDTSFGIGYTAMELAKVGKVISVDIDPAALELSKINPWSSPLFSNKNIEVRVGDIEEVVDTFSEGQFSHILHDPPTFKLAGELYSLAFYDKLYRILKSGGVLFHYIGDPNSELGFGVTKGVVERLKKAGFRNIERKENAFGVICVK